MNQKSIIIWIIENRFFKNLHILSLQLINKILLFEQYKRIII